MSRALRERDRLTPPRIAPLAFLAIALVLFTGARTPPAAHTSPGGGAEKAAPAPSPPTQPELLWDSWTSVPGPPPLDAASAAYDADDNDVVLFGGEASDGSLSDDTWLWNGKVWSLLPASQTVAPPPREMASMAFDPYLHQLILFGGRGAGGRLLDDTWAWNGYSWYELAGPGPGPRESAALAFDPDGNLVLFGGFGIPEPPPTNGHHGTTSTTSPATPALLGDTWSWTSSGWVASQATGPQPRWGASIGFDPGGQETVLFGGNSSPPGERVSSLTDTWTWNGQAWAKRAQQVKAVTPGSPTLVEDPDLETVVLLNSSVVPPTARGGTSRLSLWEWWGNSWVAMSAPTGPQGRTGAIATFDSGSFDSGGGSLLYGEGSTSAGKPLGDLWQLVSLPPSATSGTSQASTPPTTTSTSTTTASTTTTTLRGGAHSEHTAGSLPPASTIRHDTRRRASGRIIAAMVALAILIPAVAWLVMAVTGRVRRRSSPRKATGRREPERA